MTLFKKQKESSQVQKFDSKSKNNKGTWSIVLNYLQELGKALQFPIAVLPFAAILNRFGALGIGYTTDSSTHEITNQIGYWISYIIQKPGGIVFDNLPLLFAIGLAFGLAKDHRGEVALVGAVFYLAIAAMTSIEGSLPTMIYGNVLTFRGNWDTSSIDADGVAQIEHHTALFSQLIYVKNISAEDGSSIVGGTYVLGIGVLGGIVAGCLSATLYNKYSGIKLPSALSFFGGRRFVPMLALAAAIPVALTFALIWPWIQFGLMKMGTAVANPENRAIAIPGTALYGILNRLLLPFGLHQILNTFFWFQLPINGETIAPFSGDVLHPSTWTNGDINAFAAGNSNSGLFQAGFFPVMMGGIPAIAIAMIMTSKKENRKAVAGFLGGVAVVSFVSGITEPIEFSFVFLSPALLVVHALLTGVFMAITTSMQIQLGFGFSAGFIDYCVSFAQSWGFAVHRGSIWANPLWILVLTAVCGGTYYTVFYTLIKKMNIMTPGREENFGQEEETTLEPIVVSTGKTDKYSVKAATIVEAIGVDNFVSVDNCATRLRLIVKDAAIINDAKIKASGAFGIKRLTNESVQVVIGGDVEHVANAIKEQLQVKVAK